MPERDAFEELTAYLRDPHKHLYVGQDSTDPCTVCGFSLGAHLASLAEWERLDPDARGNQVWDERIP